MKQSDAVRLISSMTGRGNGQCTPAATGLAEKPGKLGRGGSPYPRPSFASFKPRAERPCFPEELRGAVQKAVGNEGLEIILEALKNGKGENGAQGVCTQMKARDVLVEAFGAVYQVASKAQRIKDIRDCLEKLKLISDAVEGLDRHGY